MKRYGCEKLAAGNYLSPSGHYRAVRLTHEIERRDGKPGYREIELWEIVTVATNSIEQTLPFYTLREAAAEMRDMESNLPAATPNQLQED